MSEVHQSLEPYETREYIGFVDLVVYQVRVIHELFTYMSYLLVNLGANERRRFQIPLYSSLITRASLPFYLSCWRRLLVLVPSPVSSPLILNSTDTDNTPGNNNVTKTIISREDFYSIYNFITPHFISYWFFPDHWDISFSRCR